MKKTANISQERGSRTMKQAILALGLAALLCTPYLTNTSSAQGNMTGHYQGMAYLAEQEIRTELQARAAEEVEMVATVEPTDKDSTQNDK